MSKRASLAARPAQRVALTLVARPLATGVKPLFVAYYRVSTQMQGRSGLGLEAQRTAVERYCGAKPIAEYTDIESGAKDNRPQLQAALAYAKLTGSTLVVAKLDRLSRNVAFLATLQDSGTKFVCADMSEANELTIHVIAAVAQAERKMISTRVKEALQAAKARGRKLGGDRGNLASVSPVGRQRSIATRQARAAERRAAVMPHVEAAKQAGKTTLQSIADHLNTLHITTPQGGRWHPASVKRLIG
jgi:DNA invertase Pin-like site-specific DNA recombinase